MVRDPRVRPGFASRSGPVSTCRCGGRYAAGTPSRSRWPGWPRRSGSAWSRPATSCRPSGTWPSGSRSAGSPCAKRSRRCARPATWRPAAAGRAARSWSYRDDARRHGWPTAARTPAAMRPRDGRRRCTTRWTSGAWSSRSRGARRRRVPSPPSDRAQLTACLAAAADRDAPTRRVADSRLHLAIAAASGSPSLAAAVADVQVTVDRLLRRDPGDRAQPRALRRAAPADRRGDPGRRSAAGAGRDGGALRRYRGAAARTAGLTSSNWLRVSRRLNGSVVDLRSNGAVAEVIGVSQPDARRAARRCRSRRDRHGRRRHHRHAGTAAGQAVPRRRSSSTRSSPHGTEGCNYLLAVDVDMNTVDGYAMSSLGRAATATSPCGPTSPRCAGCRGSRAPRWCWPTCCGSTAPTCVGLAAADPAPPARPARRARPDRLRRHRARVHRVPRLATRRPGDAATATSRPANQYNVDYSLLGTARVEPLLRRIRNEMAGAGLVPESAKGECNLGQHEIAFRYADALTLLRPPRRLQERRQGDRRAGGHGADLHGQAERSARATPATSTSRCVATDGDRRRWRATARRTCRRSGESVLAGLLAHDARLQPALRAEHQLLQALPARLVRADRAALGPRQPHLRAAAGRPRPESLRVENRTPGGDVNPYLAVAAMVAAGAVRHRERADAGAGVRRQRLRRRRRAARCPTTLREALRRCGRPRRWRATAFGEDVVAHYANNARVELAAFDAAVTDWELFRGFERL